MKKKLFSLLVLLMTAVTGAVAQSYEAKVFDLPASWEGDETYISAADMPEDFVQITEDEAKALAVPDGAVFLIYGFEGDKAKALIFESGSLSGAYEEYPNRGEVIEYQTDYNYKICYPAAASAESSVTVTEITKNQWQFTMPDYAVELEMEYEPGFNLTVGESLHGTVAFTIGNETVTEAYDDEVVTVTVTPDEGYSAKDVTVRAYTSWESAARAFRAPSLVDDITVTKQTDGTWTFTMPEYDVWVVVSYTKILQDAWIEAIADQTYTGQALTPAITVKDGETTLTLNTDYTVAYSNNVETGTATVTVTGTGNYSGTATANFTILADKTALNNAITEAEAYYSTISESNPDAAATLLTAINTAKGVQGNADATQSEVETAAQTLNDAVIAAQADVALKRVTIVIPAKSYVARVDADKRQIETAVEGVSLYTVASVTNSEVVLTSELSVIAAEMPYLIYNDNDEEKTISIVVSAEEADAVTYDSEHFKGTLEAKTFTDADMAAADHYVLSNGHDFVWVKDAGTLAAGKCWIELEKSESAGARALSIVFDGETTGISSVKTAATIEGNCYDLSGRKVAKPTKGLYIVNGRKVVIK